MSETTGLCQRFAGAWRALCGSIPAPTKDAADLESRIAGLEMDVKQRDEQIVRLRHEFALQARQTEQTVAQAGSTELEALAKRVAPLLAQLATLQAMTEAGREVRPADVLKLAGKIKQAFLETGLIPLGQPGEVCPFDSQIHQRMSGGDVQDGVPVKVRFEGYRFRDAVIVKAMVSREEEQENGGNGL